MPIFCYPLSVIRLPPHISVSAKAFTHGPQSTVDEQPQYV